MYKICISFFKHYKQYKKIYEAEKRAGLDVGLFHILKRKLKIYKQHKRAFELGKRAGSGENIYHRFGSATTVTKNAEDSYQRYAMAMRYLSQISCDKDSFIMGYNKIKKHV